VGLPKIATSSPCLARPNHQHHRQKESPVAGLGSVHGSMRSEEATGAAL
jgi:hypothetical protein